MSEHTFPEVMLDLETMGNGPDAAIVAIGAVAFDIEAGALGPCFYCRVDLSSAINAGGVMDADTVCWWMAQDDDARAEIIADDRKPIGAALAAFSSWLQSTADPEPHIWGNGAGFDNVILRGAYQRSGIPAPWAWRHDRCYRTIKALNRDIRINVAGIKHHALDDAINQTVHLLDILNPARRATWLEADKITQSAFQRTQK